MNIHPASNHHLSKPLLIVFLLAILLSGLVASLLFHFSALLPLLLVGTVLGIILLFRAPILLLFGLIVVRMSLDYSSLYFGITLYSVTLSLSQLLGIGIAFFGIMALVLKRRLLPLFPLNFPFAVIFVWGLLTLFYSLYPKNSLQELLRIFDLFALGFLAYATMKTKDDFRHLLEAFFVSSILPILFGLYQFIFHIGLVDENVAALRIFGTFSHPNVYSLYLFSLIVFAFLYLVLFAGNGLRRLFTVIFIGILSTMLLLTFARVAWIALSLFVLIMALFRYRILLFPLFLFPIILFVFSPSFEERVYESFRSDPDSSLVWRQTLWHDVTRYSIQEERLLFGSGMDTFPKVSESVRGTNHGPNDPHNDFVKFFVEGGLVGLGAFVVYLLALGTILVTQYRKSTPGSALRLSFAVMIVFFLTLQISALTDNIFKNTPVQWLFFTALGALLALSNQKVSTNNRRAEHSL